MEDAQRNLPSVDVGHFQFCAKRCIYHARIGPRSYLFHRGLARNRTMLLQSRKARRISLAARCVTESGGSSSDTGAKGNVGTDGDGGGESRNAARSASSAIVRGRDCVPQAIAGASVQFFGQEGRREVGRDVRSVGREGRHDVQSVQVPPKRGVEPPIRARAHFSKHSTCAQKGNRLHRCVRA